MDKATIIDSVYKAKLTKRATVVVFYLINRADKNMTCFPGIKTIADECNICTRTVQRALNDLIEAGFLKKESRFHEKGGQRSNLYTLMNVENINKEVPVNMVSYNDYADDKVSNNKINKCKEEVSIIIENKTDEENNKHLNKNNLKMLICKVKSTFLNLLSWGVRQVDTP